MHELKFRAWMPKYNRYASGYDTFHFSHQLNTDGCGEWWVYPADPDDDPDDTVIVEQYTGSKDKNGKEIYEGDILEDGTSEPLEYWAVKFEDGKFIGETQGVSEDIFELTDLEVVGNIHENKELLGAQ